MRPSPLPNRVTPTGAIVAVPDRCDWMGNRGCIHRDYRIARKPPTKGWIICLLEFQGWHREVMQEGKWTELFFLDEATAFAAGHRPCHLCRHADAKLYARLVGEKLMRDVDKRLDQERNGLNTRARISGYPDGTMFAYQGQSYLLWKSKCYPWTTSGYDAPIATPATTVEVLTPQTSVLALKAGYPVQIHKSLHSNDSGTQ